MFGCVFGHMFGHISVRLFGQLFGLGSVIEEKRREESRVLSSEFLVLSSECVVCTLVLARYDRQKSFPEEAGQNSKGRNSWKTKSKSSNF